MKFRTPLLLLVIVGIVCALILLYGRAAVPSPAHRPHTPRSARARREFRRMNPCPATGLLRGACPGYVIDHVKPLACGGADAPGNMQWQTNADSKAKDAVERKNCG